MNSNLFTKPLDTSRALTFYGIEALMYQGENFLVALSNCIRRLKEKNKFDSASIKEAGLGECIEKFTGMNATVNILPGYAAHVYLPPLDGSHPFHRNWFADEPLFSTAGEVILRGKGDPIAEIDFEKARVGGVYSQVPVNIYIGTWLIKDGLSVEEVAGIILHEVGHAFTYFYYLGRMYFANFLISSYAQEIMGTRDVGRRKILLKAAEKRIGLEIHNPNAIAEQPSLSKDKLETLFINSHRYTLASTTGTDIYDFRSCEQLADYFATMHGGGPYVISGLNKIYEACGDTSIMPMPIVIFGEVAKWIMLPVMVPLMLGTLLVTNPSIKAYDDPKARAKYIEMQLKGVLKNRNMPAETRKSLLASIDACGQEIKRLNDFKGMEHMVWSILSPSYRRGVKQEQSQKVLEGILFNDLYQKAAVFDSMEELNPLIDEMVVAIAESREEAMEEELAINRHEVESDLSYLQSIAERSPDEVTMESLNNIKVIMAKYGIEDEFGLESYEVVSTEAIGAWGIAAIAAAVAIAAAIIWKIIKWIQSNGESTAKAGKEASKSAETAIKVAPNLPSRADTKNTLDGVSQLTKPGVGATTKASGDTATTTGTKNSGSSTTPSKTVAYSNIGGLTLVESNLNVGQVDEMIRRAFKEAYSVASNEEFNISLEAQKMYRIYFKPGILPPFDPDTYNDAHKIIGFVNLAKFFATFQPTLARSYGVLSPNSNMKDLEKFLRAFTRMTPMEAVKDYLFSRMDLDIDNDLTQLSGKKYDAYVNSLNADGAFIIKAVEDLKQFLNPSFVNNLKSNNEVSTPHTFLNEYIVKNRNNLISPTRPTPAKPSKSLSFEVYYQFSNFNTISVPLGKTQIFKEFINNIVPKLEAEVDTGICVDAVSRAIKDLEAISKSDLSDLKAAYLRVGTSAAPEVSSKIIENFVSEHIRKLIMLLTDYERRVASLMNFTRVVSRNMSRICTFYLASCTICADFEEIK